MRLLLATLMIPELRSSPLNPGTTRTWLAASTAMGLVGLGVALLGAESVGGWVALGGFAVAGWALHHFGRAGADGA